MIDTDACYLSGFNPSTWPEPRPVRFEAFPTAEDVDGDRYVFSRWEFLDPADASCREGNDSLTCTYDAWMTDSRIRLVYHPVDGDVAPEIQLDTPADGQRSTLGEVVPVDYTCTDERDIAPTCEGTVEQGAAVDTTSVGPKTFTVRSQDGIGNTTTETVTYHVQYAFGGFSGRVDGETLNRAKAGSTVPLRFHLADADGAPIEDLARVTVTAERIVCDDASSSVDEPLVDDAEGRAGLQNLGNGDYGWNWATPRSYADSFREVTHGFDGGGSATVTFQVSR